MKVLFDRNYPKYLLDALQLIHKLDTAQLYNIRYWEKQDENETNNPVVFILDRGKRGLDITTLKHYEAGYRVFAFKLPGKQKIDLFNFSLTVLSLWPKVLETVKAEERPFVFTYKYGGRKLRKSMDINTKN
jgi:hypothetical protein